MNILFLISSRDSRQTRHSGSVRNFLNKRTPYKLMRLVLMHRDHSEFWIICTQTELDLKLTDLESKTVNIFTTYE